MKKSFLFIIITIVCCTVTILVSRDWRPAQIPNGSKFSCANCHFDPNGGGPRNNFGSAVESRVTVNGHQEFWGPSLANQDSDGDGFTNGQELGDPTGAWKVGQANPGNFNNVSNPGDPNSVPTITRIASENIPTNYRLLNNYPNPFNPTTTISFEMPQSENVSLKIYSINGELVKILVDGNFSAGKFEKVWNGKDEFGNDVSSGIYFYRLTAGKFDRSAKMILMK